MGKRKSAILAVLFAALLTLPQLAYMVFGRYVDNENYENRLLAEKPVLSMDTFRDYPSEFEEYFNDTLPFRNQLVSLNSCISYYIFHQSSNRGVVIGKDGWLFYNAFGGATDPSPVAQALGYLSFDEADLEELAVNLTGVRDRLDAYGIEFVLFIAPNKETIYSEYLPDYPVKSSITQADQLMAYLEANTDLRVVYPRDEILSFKEAYPDIILYDRLDTHWNYAGAYIGVRSLMEELGIAMPPLETLKMDEIISSRGDLANMLNLEIRDGNIDYWIEGCDEGMDALGMQGDLEIMLSTSPDADSRILFMKRDSFSTAMCSFLGSRFAESYMSDDSVFDAQMIYDCDADIFVYEIVERQIATDKLVHFTLDSGQGGN